MIPPFKTPGNASYFCSGFHSAITSPFLGKLRMRNPSAFAGPQPQHELFGANFSWRDSLFILINHTTRPAVAPYHVDPAIIFGSARRRRERPDMGASPVRCKASAAGSNDC